MGRMKHKVGKRRIKEHHKCQPCHNVSRAVTHLSAQRGWSSSILAGNVLYYRQIKSIAVTPYSPKSILYMFPTFRPE